MSRGPPRRFSRSPSANLPRRLQLAISRSSVSGWNLKLDIPAGLDWLRVSERGRAWLDALPGNVDHCGVRWTLNVGEPFPRAYTSLVLPARRRDGSECILKLAYPDRESEPEALALARCTGEGRDRLLQRDEAGGATLIERCPPGSRSRSGDRATRSRSSAGSCPDC